FMEIKSQGYTGCLSTLRNYLQKLKPTVKVRPLVRFETEPGEQMQVDFASFKHKNHRYYAFVAVLGYSRLAFVKFVKNQQVDALIACHEEAFDYFGGVPKTILYDNMKTVILKRDVYGKSKHKLQGCFYDFSKHYGFIPRVCQPYSPQTKGKVERLISYIRYSYHNPFLAGREDITLDELNIDVMNWLNNIANQRVHATTKEIPFSRWDVEKQHLLNIPNNYTTNYGLTNEASTHLTNKHIMEQNTHTLQHDLSVYESILFAGEVA
ncbi:MAG: IS21 family transposase, partial [Legionellaceae bacterium]|nr:IS21 family transposase [Legionellaceae bacterium]